MQKNIEKNQKNQSLNILSFFYLLIDIETKFGQMETKMEKKIMDMGKQI